MGVCLFLVSNYIAKVIYLIMVGSFSLLDKTGEIIFRGEQLESI